MLEDFALIGVLLFGYVAGLFKQRQIDVGLDIALRAGIAIPIPCAAKVAGLLDYADVLKAALAQARARKQPAKATADNCNLDVLFNRFARESGIDVRIIDIAAEIALHFDVLLVPVLAYALVALLPIFFAQRIGIETQLLIAVGG